MGNVKDSDCQRCADGETEQWPCTSDNIFRCRCEMKAEDMPDACTSECDTCTASPDAGGIWYHRRGLRSLRRWCWRGGRFPLRAGRVDGDRRPVLLRDEGGVFWRDGRPVRRGAALWGGMKRPPIICMNEF